LIFSLLPGSGSAAMQRAAGAPPPRAAPPDWVIESEIQNLSIMFYLLWE